MDILKTYINEKSIVSPLDGKKLSKTKRIESMYDFVQNRVYGVNYSIEERIFASTLITKILQENN